MHTPFTDSLFQTDTSIMNYKVSIPVITDNILQQNKYISTKYIFSYIRQNRKKKDLPSESCVKILTNSNLFSLNILGLMGGNLGDK